MTDDKAKQIVDWMISNQGTIRECAEALNVPKSTIHHCIHHRIKRNFSKEYLAIVSILHYNKIHKRKPRQYWK